MSDEERREFDHAFEAGRDAVKQAKYWAEHDNRAEAERYILETARQLDAALKAIGSRYGVRVEEPGS